jgi:hypothetical protein
MPEAASDSDGRTLAFLEKICGIQSAELNQFAKSQNAAKPNHKEAKTVAQGC